MPISGQKTDEDFPRGGASALTPLEARKIRDAAQEDVLFGGAQPEKKQRKKAKADIKSPPPEDSPKTFMSRKLVQYFNYKVLKQGMLVLGCIKELLHKEVIVSLPNGVAGVVRRVDLASLLHETTRRDSDAGDEELDEEVMGIRTLFAVGQLLPVSIKELDSSKHGYHKICLSVDPADINLSLNSKTVLEGMILWGMVTSIEDHGFLVSIGKSDISGFVPHQAVTGPAARVGSLRWFSVSGCRASKKVVQLSMDDSVIRGAQVSSKSVHFGSVLPGQLVTFTVKNVGESVCSGTVHGSFDAMVHVFHIPRHGAGDGLKAKSKHSARVLFVNPETKQVGVSLLPEVLEFPSVLAPCRYSIGAVESCVIVRADTKQGLLMTMPDGSYGHVHFLRISDDRIEKLSKKYKAGTSHKCRVLGFSSLDGLYTLTMQKSMLEKTFLRFDEIKPGSVVSGTVTALEDIGAFISVTDRIHGICPRLHLADINLKHPEKKFVVGKKLKCRVLLVKPSEKRLILTHKKTLVASDLPIITDLTCVQEGTVAHGFVSAIMPFGLFVSFYNGIRGLVPKSDLRLKETETMEGVFYVGQVVKCTVVSVMPEERRIVLSLQSPEALRDRPPTVIYRHSAGEVLDVTVVDHAPAGLMTKLPSGASGMLQYDHCADFPSLCRTWKQVSSSTSGIAGQILRECLCLGWDKKLKENLVSMKEVVKCREKDKSYSVVSFSDLQVGQVLGVTVALIMPYGMFVQVAPGVTGLAPNSHLADRYVANAADFYSVGQSVIAKVTEIDENKGRFLVSLKHSEVNAVQSAVFNEFRGSNLLKKYLKQRQLLLGFISSTADQSYNILISLPGEVIPVKVLTVSSTGVEVVYEPVQEGVPVNGFIPQSHKFTADFEVGKELQCFVLDVQLGEKKFLASADEDLIKEASKTTKKKRKGLDIQDGIKHDALVQVVTQDYVLVTLPALHHKIAYLPGRKDLNDIGDPLKRFYLNQKLSVVLDSSFESFNIVKRLADSAVWSKAEVGSIVTAVVKGIKPTQLNVSIESGRNFGRIHISEIWDEPNEGFSPLDGFRPMQTIQARIIAFRDAKSSSFLPISHPGRSKGVADLSIKPSVFAKDVEEIKGEEKDNFQIGAECTCYVMSTTKFCVWVTITPSVKGKIPLLQMSENMKELKKWHSMYKVGQCYQATVIKRDEDQDCLLLSRIGDPVSKSGKGQTCLGRISKIISNTGLLVELPDGKAGLVHMTQISDFYEAEPLRRFAVHEFVRCFVLAVKKKNQVDLSLRLSRILPHAHQAFPDEDREITGYDDIKEGDILRGYVKSCTKVGVFVSLSASIVGRVEIKNLSQYFVKDYQSLFPAGKLVKAKVLSIDPTNNRINLSLRGKDVCGPDPAPPPKRKTEGGDADGASDAKRKRSDSEGGEKDKEATVNSQNDSPMKDGDASVDSSDDESVEMSDSKDKTGSSEAPCLQLPSGFDWSAETFAKTGRASDTSDDDADDDAKDKSSAKKTKRQKRAAKRAEEESLQKAEQTLLDADRGPESAEDFDRLVLASPNSSILWIQFMAFHLNAAEVEKARAVANRAIKTISFREEQEKLNVWVALLNLENFYGSQETLEAAFQEALKVNEPKKVFLKMVDIYIRSNKNEPAEKLFQVMVRRFNSSKKVWLAFGQFLMKSGRLEEGRRLLQRCLKSLPERKHIETIVKFAMLEYRFGQAQRGMTVFESVLKNYPKRTDLWSIYIDMTIKEGEFDHVRNIFERATTLKLSSKKMKFLFKRYLEFERKHGSEATVEHVRTRAMEYVESQVMEEN